MEKEIYWSRFAEDFEARNTYVVGDIDLQILKNCLEEQKNLGHTLELGCGNGTYSKILARKAGQFMATDFSEEMVLTSRFRLAEHKNICVTRENCLELSFEKSSFDTLVMINLLHVISCPEKALAEAMRVLRPGGRIVIASFTTQGMGFFSKAGMIYRYLRTYGRPPGSGRTLTLETARDMIETAGFRLEDSRLIGKRCKIVFMVALAGG